jgi:hypothetical protein
MASTFNLAITNNSPFIVILVFCCGIWLQRKNKNMKQLHKQQLNPIHNENREITSNILNNTAGIGNTAQILACTISQISTCHLVGDKHFPSISMFVIRFLESNSLYVQFGLDKIIKQIVHITTMRTANSRC